jgi:hypothetical protein
MCLMLLLWCQFAAVTAAAAAAATDLLAAPTHTRPTCICQILFQPNSGLMI